MKKVNQCLILAAGNGTRLRQISGGLPKPLVKFQGKPILEHVMLRAYQAGIENFVIVVGYRSDLIRRWFDRQRLGGLSVTFIENPEYHKQNGVSVLKAKDAIHDNFLLLMADHVFEPGTAKLLMEQPLAPGEVILAVDPGVDRMRLLGAAAARRGRPQPRAQYQCAGRKTCALQERPPVDFHCGQGKLPLRPSRPDDRWWSRSD